MRIFNEYRIINLQFDTIQIHEEHNIKHHPIKKKEFFRIVVYQSSGWVGSIFMPLGRVLGFETSGFCKN